MQERPDGSFVDAVEPLRGALRLHCYRMLGSSHDGEDVVQETMLRAWRARESLKDPEMLRPWLYRIATNVCLDELKRRPRRAHVSDVYPPTADPRGPVAAPPEELSWLEPMPDSWLGPAGNTDPSARYTLKESVALAFVAALQMLSPRQRATLLLRDVVGLSAEETAEALGLSVGAANSALFRARAAIEEKLVLRGASVSATSTAEVDEELLARYLRAFEASDVDAMVALLHREVKTTMPPSPTWIDGLEANVVFYERMFGRFTHQPFRVVRISANGQPAFAVYRADSAGAPHRLRAIQVLELRDGAILCVDHFMAPEVLPIFGMQDELPAS